METEIRVAKLSREQKEKRMKEYFLVNKNTTPTLSDFSFTTKTKIGPNDLLFIGAMCLLKETTNQKIRKDRSFFFIFLEGEKKKFQVKEFTSELFEICSYFNKVTMIKVVFAFSDEFVTYKYADEKGDFLRDYRGSEVDNNFVFIQQPDDYINQLVDYQKYLQDCYSAFVGNKNGGLNFITNDYYDTKNHFNEILDAFENKKKKVIFVHGPAGTGKTILAMRLLGLYKNSRMLIINEYFEKELRSLFEKNENSDIRFFSHRNDDSEKIAEDIIQCNKYRISISVFKEKFRSFIFEKYWTKHNKQGKAPKEFWDQYLDSNRDDYQQDFFEFASRHEQQGFIPCEIFIVDEGQRVYQRTFDTAYKNQLTTIIFGDSQQKINPDTDDLELDPDNPQSVNQIASNKKEEIRIDKLDYYEIPLRYPIRISESALQKINYILGKSKVKNYDNRQENYPIEILDSCQEFKKTFDKDRESRKFICSYQDIWRYEFHERKVSLKRKVTDVRFLDNVIRLVFDDGFEAYSPKEQMYKISNQLNTKIVDMRNTFLEVCLDETKPHRYKICPPSSYTDKSSVLYSSSELFHLDSQIRTLTKNDKKDKKDKILFSPEYKTRMFTPYELISREVRNIYLYLPKFITLDKENNIIDRGSEGSRFFNKETDTNYLLNQLYVLMTRATRKIVIYCEDEILRNFFHQNSERYEKEVTLPI